MDTIVKAIRGHVVAMPANMPHKLAALFPCPLEHIPEFFQVVFLGPVSNANEAQEKLQHCPILQVNNAYQYMDIVYMYNMISLP